MTEEQRRNCPFCGSKAKLVVDDITQTWEAFIECVTCGARGPKLTDCQPGDDFSKRATNLWNHRLEPAK